VKKSKNGAKKPIAKSFALENFHVVLVATRNPLNIGAAARAMSNFGFRSLRVVNPYEAAWREAKSAVGASELLAKAQQFATVADAVADCTLIVGTTAAHNRTLQHPLRRLDEAVRVIRKNISRGERIALLFGSEKRGLSNQDFSHCDWLLRIPTSNANLSMNLGQAVAVCLYELSRSVSSRTAEKVKPVARRDNLAEKPATSAEVERITQVLLDAMKSSGYLQRHPTSDAEERLRRLVRRINLPASDAVAWLGILRQISHSLERK
jgi:TrmH family RNA methyltransferase